jgi:hypothetical protein
MHDCKVGADDSELGFDHTPHQWYEKGAGEIGLVDGKEALDANDTDGRYAEMEVSERSVYSI